MLSFDKNLCHANWMNRLIFQIALITALFTPAFGQANSLPQCSNSPITGNLPLASNWDQCIGTIIFLNGSKYAGAWENGRFSGLGTFEYNDKNDPTYGNRFIGEHKNGLRHGKGKYIFSNGGVFEGLHENGMPNGYGKDTFPDGATYEGGYLNGRFHGEGKFEYPNGDKFKGAYQAGRPNGKGEYIGSDGTIYKGDYLDGAATGYGEYTYSSGIVYKGEVLNGRHHGKGKISFPDGASYEGDFVNNMRHGFGTYFYPDGAIHEGKYQNGAPHGPGKMITTDGAVGFYVWENGERKVTKPNKLAVGKVDQYRVALVIGNGTYSSSLGPLKNPPNDARLVSETLKSLGFDVIEKVNADQKDMKIAVRDFSRKLSDSSKKQAVGLFYYAGHGIQVAGQNYLIPVGAKIESEADVDLESINANSVLMAMEAARANYNFVILDACRNNPIAKTSRSAERGLARMTTTMGSLIAYSTAPGSVALDGDGKNSPYTAALVEAMKKDLPVEKMFREIRTSVIAKTNNKQTPWESSSLIGEDFYFSRLQ